MIVMMATFIIKCVILIKQKHVIYRIRPQVSLNTININHYVNHIDYLFIAEENIWNDA
jgi:hypothetical protein